MKFKPGHSGNPAGKKPGTRDKRTELREKLRPHQDAIIKKVVEMAKAGDTAAIRLVLERLTPPLRPRDEPVPFDLVGDTLSDQARGIIAAMASGGLTPDQGTKILDALAVAVRVVEVDELAARCAALEAEIAALSGRKGPNHVGA